MNLEWLIAVTGFCFVTCFTPGPNNAMLMASGMNFGMRRTVPHLLGVWIGFPVMVFCVGLGVAEVFRAVPPLFMALKIVGVVYLLWLAIEIARADAVKVASGKARPLTFLQAAAFQWVNPKAWIMAIGISATYLVQDAFWMSLVVFSTVFLIAGLCSSVTWTLGGAGLGALLAQPARVRVINVALAAVLVASLWPVAVEIADAMAQVVVGGAEKVAPGI